MSAADDQVAALVSLYGQQPEPMRLQLAELADGAHAQLHELRRHATPERCERVATTLEGIRRHCLQLAAALRREVAE